jgi:chromosome segregation ATPase
MEYSMTRFASLLPQITDLLEDIEASEGPEQSLRALELAKILTVWSLSTESFPTSGSPRLKSATYMHSMLDAVLPSLAGMIDEFKIQGKKYAQNLEQVASQSSQLQGELTTLTQEMEGVQADLAAANQDLPGLEARVAELRRQVEHVRGLQRELTELTDGVGREMEAFLDSANPAGIIAATRNFWSHRQRILEFYQEYIGANDRIQQMLDVQGHDTDKAAVLDRLAALGQELRDIDALLQAQVEAQDRGDAVLPVTAV